jgi:ABC-2 type transport system permease protein
VPIHDLGYRSWDETAPRGGWRVGVIAATGIRLAWQSYWLRRMLLVAWLPAISLGFILFLYEYSLTQPMNDRWAALLLSRLPQGRVVVESVVRDPDGARREVWAFLLLTLFRYPQAFLMVLLVALVAPPLISRDLRSRAFLLYFSRPLGQLDYILGKSLIVYFYVAMITTLPALALYILGVFLSPDLSVIAYTWDLPLRIVAASAWLIIPTTAMALAFSALATESRYAAFAWIAVWALGWAAYANLTAVKFEQTARTESIRESYWTLVSLYHSLGHVQTWVFGLEPLGVRVLVPIALLVAITLVACLVIARRVSAPMRM